MKDPNWPLDSKPWFFTGPTSFWNRYKRQIKVANEDIKEGFKTRQNRLLMIGYLGKRKMRHYFLRTWFVMILKYRHGNGDGSCISQLPVTRMKYLRWLSYKEKKRVVCFKWERVQSKTEWAHCFWPLVSKGSSRGRVPSSCWLHQRHAFQ